MTKWREAFRTEHISFHYPPLLSAFDSLLEKLTFGHQYECLGTIRSRNAIYYPFPPGLMTNPARKAHLNGQLQRDVRVLQTSHPQRNRAIFGQMPSYSMARVLCIHSQVCVSRGRGRYVLPTVTDKSARPHHPCPPSVLIPASQARCGFDSDWQMAGQANCDTSFGRCSRARGTAKSEEPP
jgi:hypothetical protein